MLSKTVSKEHYKAKPRERIKLSNKRIQKRRRKRKNPSQVSDFQHYTSMLKTVCRVGLEDTV